MDRLGIDDVADPVLDDLAGQEPPLPDHVAVQLDPLHARRHRVAHDRDEHHGPQGDGHAHPERRQGEHHGGRRQRADEEQEDARHRDADDDGAQPDQRLVHDG